jgi:hypothetical protein
LHPDPAVLALPAQIVVGAFEDGCLEAVWSLELEIEQRFGGAQPMLLFGRKIRSPGPTGRMPSSDSTVALPLMMK